MYLKFDMNLEDISCLYKYLGCFRNSMKFYKSVEDNTVENDIYHKTTNAHHYLPYDSSRTP